MTMKMRPLKYRLVGFGHRAQVGKSTAAAALGFTRVYSIADSIRERALFLNPLLEPYGLRLADAVNQLGWDKAKVDMVEVREVLQEVAEEGRRDDPAHWCRQPLNHAEYSVYQLGNSAAIDDVRFPNEAQAIRDAGGFLVRIDRASAPVLDHPSESALDDWDWDLVIENNGTEEEFLDAVGAALRGP